jgi:hypothetical protein
VAGVQVGMFIFIIAVFDLGCGALVFLEIILPFRIWSFFSDEPDLLQTVANPERVFARFAVADDINAIGQYKDVFVPSLL